MGLLDVGAALSGIGSVAGAVGSFSNAKKSGKEARRQFNQQMNESIQRRVADARAAGVHPLFALGASVGASPTITAGQYGSGSAVGDALQGVGGAIKGYSAAKGLQRMQAAQIRSAEASAARDEAEAQLALSNAKRVEQDMASRGHDGFQMHAYGAKKSPDLVFGPAEFVAPQVPFSQEVGVRAGNIPERIRMTGRDGRTIDVINPEANFEFLPELLWARQKAQYWTTDQMERFAQWLKKKGIKFHRR